MKKFISSLIVLVIILSSFSFISCVKAENEIIEESKTEKINKIIEELEEEIINTIGEENIENIEKELMEAIQNLRDNAVAELGKIEEEYGIDLIEYKNRITTIVEKYQTVEEYSKEDLVNDLQTIYNDLLQEAEDEGVKEKIEENIAKAYAEVREYVEKNIDEIKAEVKEDIEILKETYPKLQEIEDLDDLADMVLSKISEYEDSILELIEDYQENPEGTIEELTSKINKKMSSLRAEAEKNTKLIYNYVINNEIMKFDVLEGGNQVFDKNNAKDLTFRFDIYYLLYRKYGKIYIDGKLVNEENYTTKKGSTIVTVDQDYLNSLGAGDHTIKIALGKNNEFGMSNTNFTVVDAKKEGTDIKEDKPKSVSPATGDEIGLYIMLFIVATLAISGTFKNKNV